MSDGEGLTPADRGPVVPDESDPDTWLTRSAPPAPGAAPWERSRHPREPVSPSPRRDASGDTTGGDTTGDETAGGVTVGGGPAGAHVGGVTVADLIARISGGADPRPRRRHRAAPDPADEPDESPRTAALEPPSAPEDPAVHDEAAVYDQPSGYDDPSEQDDRSAAVAALGGDAGPLRTGRFARYADAPAASDLPEVTAAMADHGVPHAVDDPARLDTFGPKHNPTPHIPPRTRRRALLLGRTAAALIAVLALALTGAAWQWQAAKDRSLNTVAALDPDSRDIVDPNAQFGDENFLIVGVDSRIGENSDMGAGDTEDAAGARSDTVMLVNIPANRKRVVAVSFPRDLAISSTKCQAWNPETGKYGPVYDSDTESYGPDQVYTENKLNSAYSFGGPKCLVKVIQKLSGLSINRFMAVDFAGFAKMVDALGGVEVCSTTPLKDYELGTVLADAGPQLIDGHTALQYVRARQVTTETNGDYGRIKRQQLFLSSLLRSLISKDTFFSLSKLNNVVNMFISDSYVDHIQTKDLVDLGQSLQGVNAGRITFVTVPTGETDADGNEPPRVQDMRSLFSAIIDDDPLPEERPAAPAPPSPAGTTTPPRPAPGSDDVVDAMATDPADVTVRVSNSTGQSGLATTAARELEAHGFNVAEPDNYSGRVRSTTVMYSDGNQEAAATVASSFATPTIERVAGMGSEVRVVLGSDFRAVAAPTPSGNTVSVHLVKSATATPTELPEDLTVTNAADTTCE